MHTHTVSGFIQPTVMGVQSKRVQESGYVHIGPGYLAGTFVSTASKDGPVKPSITFREMVDLTTPGEVLVGTFTPADATFYLIPIGFSRGLWIDITGNVDCTLNYI